MKNIFKNLHGFFYKLLLPFLIIPPGQSVNGQFHSFHRTNIINFIDFWKSRITGNVLDIGAGTWEYPRKSFQDQCRYLAVDAFNHPNVDIVCDIHHLERQFEPESWDCILCLDVLEHVQQPQVVILQAYQLLKPGATLLITVPFFYPLHGSHQTKDYWRISPEGLQYLLQDFAGFLRVDVQIQGNSKYPFSITASAIK